MDVYKKALSIVNRLTTEGHTAYFAGGWVRDLIMGHPSEDIDIATTALPGQIMDLFPNTILVGLAFGVVIIVIEGHQFEVATFRKDMNYIDGRRPETIEPSTPIEDALRRDFTINGMFYDPIKEVVLDYVDGKADISRNLIRTIGDPHERFFEDRLRMIRAFRFSARFEFNIEPETQEAIKEHADRLFPSVAMERVWQEFNKMASYPRFDHALIEMHRLTLLEAIFPELQELHLNDLRQLVSSFHLFPKDCPTILYLIELFPNSGLEDKIEIARRLKAGNKDIKLLEFYDNFSKALENESIPHNEWVKFYAHTHFNLCFQVFAAKASEQQKIQLENHLSNIKKLASHIDRIKQGTPLITSEILKKEGVKPGIKMGLLLKEAEKIAINHNLDDPKIVLKLLKNHPFWHA